MSAPRVFDTSKKLPKNAYDIIIYDEEMDKHVHITIMEALFASGIWNEDASNYEPSGGFFGEGYAETTDGGKDFEASCAAGPPSGEPAYAGTADGIRNILKAGRNDGKGGAVDPNVANGIKKNIEAGKWLPIEVVIARPFIEHLMMSAIMTVSGRDTGSTLFGPADMQISVSRHYSNQSGSLPVIQTGIEYDSGRLWISRYRDDLKSALESGFRSPNTCLCNSAFSPSGPSNDSEIDVFPWLVPSSRRSLSNTLLIAHAGIVHCKNKRSPTWIVDSLKTSTSPTSYGTCSPDLRLYKLLLYQPFVVSKKTVLCWTLSPSQSLSTSEQ